MTKRLSRRKALRLGAAAAGSLPLVHISTAGAAGRLSLALWDHWVPAGNDAMRKLIGPWAEKNKVNVQLDFLTAIGNKINITMAAEAQAKTGHDIYAFDMWSVHEYADSLDPVDGIMKDFVAKYGKIGRAYEYLGVSDGHWKAIPVAWGSAPLTACGRISMLQKYAGIDVRKWFPNAPSTPAASADWTYETQLKAAEACAKAGYHFGFGCGSTTDSNQTWGATFGAFGADLVDAEGNVTVDSDNVKMALEYAKRMVPFLPADTVSYDDASNNRALISGKSAMIWNPPGRWPSEMPRRSPRIAGPFPIRGGRKAGWSRCAPTSSASGASRRTSRRRWTCCATSANASRWRR
jgi:ABC-type glycerol-3-phosphate transport system substrate-binding protein